MLDVVQSGTEVILVQEYVHGVPFDKLLRAVNQQKKVLPVSVVTAIVSGMLAGLHAAHEATDELGEPLEIVHRDVSPQNVIVGVDGIPRLLDFGVAKATLSDHATRAGVFKEKLAYTSPELLQGIVTQSTDIYAASVVLWEALVGRRLYLAVNEAELVAAVMSGTVQTLTAVVDKATVIADRWELLQKVEPIVARGLAFAMEDRFLTAAAMQDALLKAAPMGTPAEVSKWATFAVLLVIGGLLAAILLLLIRSPREAAPVTSAAPSTTSTTSTSVAAALFPRPAPEPVAVEVPSATPIATASAMATPDGGPTASARAPLAAPAAPIRIVPRAVAPVVGVFPAAAPGGPEMKRWSGPLVLVGIGAAAMIAGGVLVGVGLSKVPGSCSLSTNECAAPPKDPVLAQASSGVSMANLGGVLGGVGGAAFVGSLIWYFAQTPHAATPAASTVSRGLVPWIGPQGAGLSFSGAL